MRGWLPQASGNPLLAEYVANLTVQSDFGRPGAIVITNLHSKEFYLMEIVIHGFSGGPVIFPSNSWIHSRSDNPQSRILFSNQVRNSNNCWAIVSLLILYDQFWCQPVYQPIVSDIFRR